MTLLIDNSQLLSLSLYDDDDDFCLGTQTKRALQLGLRHAHARYDPLLELGRAGSTSLPIDHSSMNNHPVRSALFGRHHFARAIAYSKRAPYDAVVRARRATPNLVIIVYIVLHTVTLFLPSAIVQAQELWLTPMHKCVERGRAAERASRQSVAELGNCRELSSSSSSSKSFGCTQFIKDAKWTLAGRIVMKKK
uniref:Uncharacterized protein n=1 Tax=Trichuris muris TaxID=70415 RepID=A0A5S6QTN9_TRIMR